MYLIIYYNLIKDKKNEKQNKDIIIFIQPDRLKGRYLFRSAVRRVLEYMEWITREEIIKEISDDVTINIRMVQQRDKIEKKLLTLEVFNETYVYIVC